MSARSDEYGKHKQNWISGKLNTIFSNCSICCDDIRGINHVDLSGCWCLSVYVCHLWTNVEPNRESIFAMTQIAQNMDMTEISLEYLRTY